MKSKNLTRTSIYAYLVCALVGVFVAFMLPATDPVLRTYSGIAGTIFEFEEKYENVLLALGTAWLLYLLLRQKVHGRQAMVMCGGLGLAGMRLVIALIAYFQR